MQIRFCIHCDYKKRDDNFEINDATRNNPESRSIGHVNICLDAMKKPTEGG